MAPVSKKNGVADGARTHDNRNHNPGLYQLSYSHRRPVIIAASTLNTMTLFHRAVICGRWDFHAHFQSVLEQREVR